MSGKKNKVVEAGEVVLVDKPEPKPVKPVPPPKPSIPTEIAPTTLERMKPKKELSEAQKVNLAKLIERNKAKANERRNVITNNIPEVIPENKIAVVVKPKRKYIRKAPAYNARDIPTPEETEEEEYASPPRQKKPVKKAVRKPRYETETSDTSEYDESSSDDEEKVEKYVRKAQKRMDTVQAIETRLKHMSNPYQARNLSIF